MTLTRNCWSGSARAQGEYSKCDLRPKVRELVNERFFGLAVVVPDHSGPGGRLLLDKGDDGVQWIRQHEHNLFVRERTGEVVPAHSPSPVCDGNRVAWWRSTSHCMVASVELAALTSALRGLGRSTGKWPTRRKKDCTTLAEPEENSVRACSR
jgi:hypothetical protein